MHAFETLVFLAFSLKRHNSIFIINFSLEKNSISTPHYSSSDKQQFKSRSDSPRRRLADMEQLCSGWECHSALAGMTPHHELCAVRAGRRRSGRHDGMMFMHRQLTPPQPRVTARATLGPRDVMGSIKINHVVDDVGMGRGWHRWLLLKELATLV